MSVINGKNIFISIRDANGVYYPIACDSSCTISLSRPTMGITGPGDGKWRKLIPGGKISASVTGNGLINFNKNTSLYALQSLLINGTEVRMMCEIPDPKAGGSVVYWMQGYVVSTELTGAYRAAGSFTYNIDITGQIDIFNTVPVDENELGILNILLVAPGGEPLDIDNNDNNLII